MNTTLPTLFLALLLTPVAVAQTVTDTALAPELSPWIGSGDWRLGAIFGIAALLGAATVVYRSLGGDMPGVPGFLTLRKRQFDHDQEVKKLAARAVDGKHDPGEEYMRDLILERERTIHADRRRMFRTAGFLFTAIGVLVALLFARNAYEALAFGAGGPAIVTQLLAKQNAQKIGALKDAALKGKSVTGLLNGKLAIATEDEATEFAKFL